MKLYEITLGDGQPVALEALSCVSFTSSKEKINQIIKIIPKFAFIMSQFCHNDGPWLQLADADLEWLGFS
jgi:hypothetical protein